MIVPQYNQVKIIANESTPTVDRHLIHVITEQGLRWSEGLEVVLKKSCYITLEDTDIITGLLPFMLAAVECNSDMNTVFQLLRNNPSVMKRVNRIR